MEISMFGLLSLVGLSGGLAIWLRLEIVRRAAYQKEWARLEGERLEIWGQLDDAKKEIDDLLNYQGIYDGLLPAAREDVKQLLKGLSEEDPGLKACRAFLRSLAVDLSITARAYQGVDAEEMVRNQVAWATALDAERLFVKLLAEAKAEFLRAKRRAEKKEGGEAVDGSSS
ncbi:hypothetical protein [Ruficoccus sp. ZRK36]|uniref:hypothetical protein n=1 Tax=Ruficoccus sp. ZRK36 TaxID=2866311 RepID=UPI001C738EB7|nr:hypothetical protein [Ruficoccus sp. ZRK36]QYY35307.1 hypothetical protein K0V07_13525 [Ruficoccus sp. ZRK36]